MRWLFSNLVLKVLLGAAIVVGVVGANIQPKGDVACSEIEHNPQKSAVFECPAGLNSVALSNHLGIYASATVTSSIRSEAWLTKLGDAENLKTLQAGKVGPFGVIGPGAFMAVDNSEGLLYVLMPAKGLINIAWNIPSAPSN